MNKHNQNTYILTLYPILSRQSDSVEHSPYVELLNDALNNNHTLQYMNKRNQNTYQHCVRSSTDIQSMLNCSMMP